MAIQWSLFFVKSNLKFEEEKNIPAVLFVLSPKIYPSKRRRLSWEFPPASLAIQWTPFRSEKCFQDLLCSFHDGRVLKLTLNKK